MDYIKQLQTKGYCVIPNVLSETQINHAKDLFYKWQNNTKSR